MEGNALFEGLSSFLTENNLMNQDMLEDSLNKSEEKKEEPIKKEEEKVEDKSITPEEAEEIFKAEEQEEENGEDKTKVKKEENNEEDEPNTYSLIAQLLKEEGILEAEFKSAEEMVNTFQDVIKSGIESYKEELPDEIKSLIENYEEGVPLDEIVKLKSERIRLENITDDSLEDNIELQKTIYKDYLRNTTKFSEAKIEKEISKLLDLDELFDNSKEAIEELKQIKAEEEKELKQEAVKQKQLAEQNYRKQVNELNNRVKETKEILPGIKLTEKEQKELFKSITTPVETRGDQLYNQVMLVREKDPIGFEMKLNYYIKLGLFDETPKLDKILKSTETKAVSKLEKQLEEVTKKEIIKRNNGSRIDGEKSNTLEALKSLYNK
jgi:hypothetical protein